MTDINEWFCYLLYLQRSKTKNMMIYIGATVNPFHRLRQHNCEITGGAKKTTLKINETDKWKLFCYFSGFPNQHAALQFERKWQMLSGKRGTKKKPNRDPIIIKQLNAAKKILISGKSTATSDIFCENFTLNINYVDPLCSEYIDHLIDIYYLCMQNNIKYMNKIHQK